jgi:L-aspartate oxidase
MAEPLETDYLVIGSGIAGLNFALLAAEHGRVVVVTKKQPDDTNTNWAQGGVAAALSPEDSLEQHVQDTLTAGRPVRPRRGRAVRHQRPGEVKRLLDIGVRLARTPGGELDLGREGAHTQPRRALAGRHRPRDPARADRGGCAASEHHAASTSTSRWICVDGQVRRRSGVLSGAYA